MNGIRETGAHSEANGPHRGPPLTPLSLLCVGLLFGGIAIGVGIGGVMPLPYGPVGAVAAYVRAQPTALRVMAVATFASAVPLAIYAATAAARLRQLGAGRAAAAIALTAGALAAGALGLAGVLGWAMSWPEVSADTAVARALYLLVFLTGGPAHIVALGLLVAAMAAPRGVLPGPLARAGLATAVLAESAAGVLIWPALGVLLPVARVVALTWLVVAGVAITHAAQRDSSSR
ncbi:hypothetical protein [Mycobacterium intracellulare]|uniref:DUF4386 domain-containing protein n=1 Tax=Mycobacterium intracellulare (strain ATCC 13950 / DSM 43223 / JCM 6384 / NCTC 13025 / 3600) TaxID=487521 RepID=H8IR49_MYCIA|nr:hypothetical protein [Mycobacterium intracellulare]AFC43070.1 hypothetical protein OCU_18510 [Mycobacterium intracellulare ATCC 13950]ETZ36832.1 putative membrane protein [Mycobacterium intracellulare MIN_061107_1834]MCA2271710.1 hypothetical protein [Mycobacterium intracellulare]MCA2323383.1 hypothetical protein [Mycobacterium intracellulare]UEB23175.1 hypothetical protein LK403_17805 [Mycobacterium intracellulare]